MSKPRFLERLHAPHSSFFGPVIAALAEPEGAKGQISLDFDGAEDQLYPLLEEQSRHRWSKPAYLGPERNEVLFGRHVSERETLISVKSRVSAERRPQSS